MRKQDTISRKRMAQILKEEVAAFQLEEQVLREHEAAIKARKDVKSLVAEEFIKRYYGSHIDIHRMDEGLWDKVKGGLAKMGQISNLIPGQRAKKAKSAEDLAAALEAAGENMFTKALETLKKSGFPNQENSKEFRRDVNSIVQMYGMVIASVEAGNTPYEAGVKTLELLQQYVTNAATQLKSVYGVTNEELEAEKLAEAEESELDALEEAYREEETALTEELVQEINLNRIDRLVDAGRISPMDGVKRIEKAMRGPAGKGLKKAFRNRTKRAVRDQIIQKAVEKHGGEAVKKAVPDLISKYTPKIAQSICFLGGTKISMADGSYKNIEDIKINDEVRSFDTRKNEVVNSQVYQLFEHPDTCGHMIINNNLKLTDNHPMWVPALSQWVDAGDLTIGTKLLHTDGSEILVETIEESDDVTTVYNFEVETYHTYFAENHLVHNKIAPQMPGAIGGAVTTTPKIAGPIHTTIKKAPTLGGLMAYLGVTPMMAAGAGAAAAAGFLFYKNRKSSRAAQLRDMGKKLVVPPDLEQKSIDAEDLMTKDIDQEKEELAQAKGDESGGEVDPDAPTAKMSPGGELPPDDLTKGSARSDPTDPEAAAAGRGDIYVFKGKGGKGLQSQLAKVGVQGRDMSGLLKGLRADLTDAGFNVMEEAKREVIALTNTLAALEQMADPAQKEAAKKILVQMLRANRVKLGPQDSRALAPGGAGKPDAPTDQTDDMGKTDVPQGGVVPGDVSQTAATVKMPGGAVDPNAPTVKAAAAGEEDEEEEALTVKKSQAGYKQAVQEQALLERWHKLAGIIKG